MNLGAPAMVATGILLKGFGVLLILGSFALAVASNAVAAAGIFFAGVILLVIGHVVKSAGKHAKHVVEIRTEK